MSNYIWSNRTIDYFLSVTSMIPPTITQIGEKRWMVFTGPEGGWFRIDDTVTLEMAMNKWIPWSPTAKTVQPPKEDFHEFKIAGSKGNQYAVTLRNGNWSCECVGFGFRRKCKHVEKAKETLTNN